MKLWSFRKKLIKILIQKLSYQELKKKRKTSKMTMKKRKN